MSEALATALDRWQADPSSAVLVAQRENLVYRAQTTQGPIALRLHRPGLRTTAQLRSEMEWMAFLERQGVSVPRAIPSQNGALLEDCGTHQASALAWLKGEALGAEGRLIEREGAEPHFFAMGQEVHKLLTASRAFVPSAGFDRPTWDLTGERPLWGRFWDQPFLEPEDQRLFRRARDAARERLQDVKTPQQLIHADLVSENIILGPERPVIIDFDDSGWGHMEFELAAILNKADREEHPEALQEAFLAGLQDQQSYDLRHLPLFRALRAFTYIGWVATRLDEPGGLARAARFVGYGRAWASRFF